MSYITLRSARDVGLLLRDARKRARLDQAELAARIGVSRKWVVEAERGNEGASLGAVLRALEAVGVHLTSLVDDRASPTKRRNEDAAVVDIDEIVERSRKKKR